MPTSPARDASIQLTEEGKQASRSQIVDSDAGGRPQSSIAAAMA
jgi:hypothetical protein